MSFPAPREFQQRAHEALRQGVRDGHRRQVLMAATGAGKTYLGLRICHEALERGKRAIFVADRTTLINQTSETCDRYGLTEHGVIQADHWRTRPQHPLQIASAQTLARRRWPDADVIIIDECHTQLKAWTEYIPNTLAVVVGLSATPFSVGLGQLFSRVVNAATMHELTASGVLVPMRVLSARRPDMTGAKVNSRGEWDENEAAERGMEILGDVVAEWQQHGDNRKTIVFASNIAHCESLAKQFEHAGVMASVFTSKTSAAQREALLAEYKKPDSALRVLVSVEALAKGFDVPDVGCVVDCRPLRKSLSTAIQMWGRGLRSSPETGKTDCILLDHCIATGQRVLTHRGLVRIEEILLTDKLWDGHEFVAHKGVVSRGIKPVIHYGGLTATADHPVKTAQGWRTLGQCADEQAAIVTTGIGWAPIRERDGCFTRRALAWPARAALHACALRVRNVWLSIGDFTVELAGWAHKGLSRLQSTSAIPEVAVCAGAQHEAALHKSEGSAFQGLRGQGDRVPFRIRDHLRTVGAGQLGNSSRPGSDGARSEEQQWPLRAGQHSVVNPAAEHEQHPRQQVESADAQVQVGISGSALRRRLAALLAFGRTLIRGNCGAMEQAVPQAEREVWDILDCGPRNSFTCEGLLVHNSGNIIRFREDFESFYFSGLDSLDDGARLDKTVRKEPEPDTVPRGCPVCGYRPFVRRCMACGHETVRPEMVAHGAGEMQEVVLLGGKRMGDSREHLWFQCASYAKTFSRPEKQQARAACIYRDIMGVWPPRQWTVESAPRVEVTRAVLNKIAQKNIAYKKATGRASYAV